MRQSDLNGERAPCSREERGFTLVELLIAVATIAVLMAIAIPTLQDARVRSEMRAIVSDLRTVHTAFKQYYLDHGGYPEQGGSFDLAKFSPLDTEGYYRGLVTARMIDSQADAYDAPDDEGTNQEFWLELTMKRKPSVRFLVCDSDDAPLGGGTAFDGVYAFDAGVRQRF